MRKWLSEEIFSWSPGFHGGRKSAPADVRRPHDIFAHAERLAGTLGATEFAIADSISNLKRAVNVRLRHIEDLYGLTRRFPKSTGALERLEAIGLARPFLIRQLFDLRNEIEHIDAIPPSRSRCLELVDVVWYFLQTTDFACRTVPHGVVLRQGEEEMFGTTPSVTIAVDSSVPDKAEVDGWIPMSLLVDDSRQGHVPVDLRVLRERNSFEPTPQDDPVMALVRLDQSLRGDDQRWFSGMLITAPAVQQRIWRLALQTL